MTVLQNVTRGFGRVQELVVIALRRLKNRSRTARLVTAERTALIAPTLRRGYFLLLGRPEPLDKAKLQQQLIEFYDGFERLVDLACAGARAGATPGLSQEYVSLCQRMQADYPPLRNYVLAYLKVEVSDTEFGMNLCGRPTDAVESLIYAPSLGELLAKDDGEMMDRIERSRDALYRFGDHLRASR